MEMLNEIINQVNTILWSYILIVLHMPKLAKLFSLLLMTTFALVYNSLQANTITLSLVGNYYYGEINLAFLTGSKAALYVFRAAVVAMTMFGSIASLPLVWNLADLFMAFLATTNLYAISRLFKFAKIALDDYEQQLARGMDPEFDPHVLPSLDGVYAWGMEKK